MKQLAIILLILGVAITGLIWGASFITPSQHRFKSTPPSTEVSPRLKGIFSGMRQGFSN